MCVCVCACVCVCGVWRVCGVCGVCACVCGVCVVCGVVCVVHCALRGVVCVCVCVCVFARARHIWIEQASWYHLAAVAGSLHARSAAQLKNSLEQSQELALPGSSDLMQSMYESMQSLVLFGLHLTGASHCPGPQPLPTHKSRCMAWLIVSGRVVSPESDRAQSFGLKYNSHRHAHAYMLTPVSPYPRSSSTRAAACSSSTREQRRTRATLCCRKGQASP